MADSTPPPAPSKTIVFVRRTASTLSLWALVSAVFLSHRSWAFLGLIGILTIVATIEYFRMLRAADVRGFPRFGMLLAVAYSMALYLPFLAGNQPPPYLDALAVFIALAGAFTLQLRHAVRGVESLLAVAATVLGFVYIAWLFNFSARLIFAVPGGLDLPGRVSASGAFLLLWLLAVTKFTDMGAYITGSVFGRHKMIPHISPGKTWEGFGGALFFSQLAGCGLYAAFPAELAFFGTWAHVIALGFLLAILAVIGDLAESVVKRALGAKDSGRMLPGIGGSLDLIDSVCFTAPALYFYLKWFLLPEA
ncbi:MAG: CDP-archaeol synthase [Luteolibacter sp.]|jgi:phosphatidate cytidylyltransferase|nr:CDP-archaeol synthase [Luteolibacter sp.]